MNRQIEKQIRQYFAVCGLIVIGAFSIVVAAIAQAPAMSIEGRWQGTLDTGQAQLRLVLELSREKGDVLSGTLISVDQGGARIPIERAEIKGNSLFLDVKVVGGNFDGSISEDKKRITGTWTQGIALPLEFKRAVDP